jgi:hypothetical protein
MRAIAELLASGGWTMRSGMSPGADQAFYRGALAGRGPIELYLPWPGFEDGARRTGEESSVFTLHEPSERAYELAASANSGWSTLTEGARRLLARDIHQVLGPDLRSPVAFVVCWTPDGDTDGTGPSSGGTGQALRVASGLGITVMNLSRLE